MAKIGPPISLFWSIPGLLWSSSRQLQDLGDPIEVLSRPGEPSCDRTQNYWALAQRKALKLEDAATTQRLPASLRQTAGLWEELAIYSRQALQLRLSEGAFMNIIYLQGARVFSVVQMPDPEQGGLIGPAKSIALFAHCERRSIPIMTFNAGNRLVSRSQLCC
ncbi:hypothetical protein WJX73_008954 [Symbiochloris irregularis]|uniref:Uncharacterized protein n=1 Tax=Symbiochloris irregularis TaxID=706552 RepID=A0AAW1NTB4_9CHLO